MSQPQAEQPETKEELALLLGTGCEMLAKHHTACQGVLHTPPECIKMTAFDTLMAS